MWEWECERVPLSFDDGVISNATNIYTDLIQMKLIACKRLANFAYIISAMCFLSIIF